MFGVSKFEAQLFHALVNYCHTVKPLREANGQPYVVGNLFMFSLIFWTAEGAWTEASWIVFFFGGGDLLQVRKNHPYESITVRSYFMIMQVELVYPVDL